MDDREIAEKAVRRVLSRLYGDHEYLISIATTDILAAIAESRQPENGIPLAPNFAAQQFVRNYRINRGWLDQEWSVPQTAEIAQAYHEAASSLKGIREVEESRGQPEPPKSKGESQ